MAVGEGKFVLYSRIEPPLPAGDYRLTARQRLTAADATGALDENALPTASLPTHLRVRSPLFALPPDQVLSTYPPANSEGSFGTRLAQIVIKRRTLPWERLVAPTATNATPWLALVLIAEGEAELRTNQPVAECVTPGVTLAGEADVEKGHYLVVRRSILDRVFPTQLDVPLLAHAREVDIHDTELMMGDDDGFLAVVVSNRLPLAGRDAEGREVPVKYLAALVNLEGQFDKLLPRAPARSPFTTFVTMGAALAMDAARLDHVAMGRPPTADTIINPVINPASPRRPKSAEAKSAAQTLKAGAPAAAASAANVGGAAQWSSSATLDTSADVYLQMAQPFALAAIDGTSLLEPTYRFPVLLHWTFTSTGNTTYRKLMEDLDAGLLGTVHDTTVGPSGSAPDRRPDRPAGRPPLEVVETGHVGLVQRTRRGDEVRAWYRGPFVPHPTADPPEGRLPLAHASDQLRVVVPDGREDLSLASAFEIGRLLALARPSMVAALLRWRQIHYQVARRATIWSEVASFLGALEVERVGPDLGILLGRSLARTIAGHPDDFLGAPRALVDPGRALPFEGRASALEELSNGFGIDVATFEGELADVLGKLRETVPPVVKPSLSFANIAKSAAGKLLGGVLDRQLVGLVADAVPGSIAGVGVMGGAFGPGGIVRPGGKIPGGVFSGGVLRDTAAPRGRVKPRERDALDRLVDAMTSRKEKP